MSEYLAENPISVYIAAPYTADTPEQVERNVQRAISMANHLMDYGLLVYCPHLSHYMHAQQPREYEAWMEHGLAWVTRCDAVVRIPGESPGADREVDSMREDGQGIILVADRKAGPVERGLDQYGTWVWSCDWHETRLTVAQLQTLLFHCNLWDDPFYVEDAEDAEPIDDSEMPLSGQPQQSAESEDAMARYITQECDELKALLLDKNAKYGNSVAMPVRVFSKTDALEGIRVRMDDKLSRIMRGHAADTEDAALDLAGYILLERAARKYRSSWEPE